MNYIIAKLNQFESLSLSDIESIIDYLKKNPKLKAYVSMATTMIKKYNSCSKSERVTLVSQLKRLFPM